MQTTKYRYRVEAKGPSGKWSLHLRLYKTPESALRCGAKHAPGLELRVVVVSPDRVGHGTDLDGGLPMYMR